MPHSQNGWTTIDRRDCHSWSLSPALQPLPLVPGPGGFVLAHYALWHHEMVESIGGRVMDDWGYAHRPIRGSLSGWSNHSSGTAMDLNALLHPLGVRHSYRPEQEHRIRKRLRGRYEGIIRWGGDYSRRADEMHFELVEDRSATRAVADRLLGTPRGCRVVARNLVAARW